MDMEKVAELKRKAKKCIRLTNATGKGLPCVTSKSGVQCCDIFKAIKEMEHVLKGE